MISIIAIVVSVFAVVLSVVALKIALNQKIEIEILTRDLKIILSKQIKELSIS